MLCFVVCHFGPQEKSYGLGKAVVVGSWSSHRCFFEILEKLLPASLAIQVRCGMTRINLKAQQVGEHIKSQCQAETGANVKVVTDGRVVLLFFFHLSSEGVQFQHPSTLQVLLGCLRPGSSTQVMCWGGCCAFLDVIAEEFFASISMNYSGSRWGYFFMASFLSLADVVLAAWSF